VCRRQTAASTTHPERVGYLSLPALTHVLGLVTWMLGPGLVYLLTDDEYTKQNAARAIEWSATVTYLFLGPPLTLFGSYELLDVLGAVDPNFTALVFINWAYVAVLAALYTVPFVQLAVCLVGTQRAAQGTLWTYPLTVRFRGDSD
jgi:uncharacterized Tic20 family protein